MIITINGDESTLLLQDILTIVLPKSVLPFSMAFSRPVANLFFTDAQCLEKKEIFAGLAFFAVRSLILRKPLKTQLKGFYYWKRVR